MKKIFFAYLSAVLFLAPLSAAEKEVKRETDEEFYSELTRFLSIMVLAKQHYVDADKATYKTLFRGAANGMLKALDRFSGCEEPEKFKSTIENTRGSFCGIGATVTDRGGYLSIVSLIPGSPAAKAGIRPGDRISVIGGKKTAGISLTDAVSALKGPAGTVVELEIYRPENDTRYKFKITRAKIDVASVRNAGRFEDFGYIRIASFTTSTAQDVAKYLQSQKNLQGLIIDLRNNPGGLLKTAVETCSLFLPAGQPVVSVERRTGPAVVWKSVKCRKELELPIVILINGNSASASEIVASCMKDYKRAVLIGEKTFGKGSVQTLIPLSSGGGARITIAKYFTPSRRPIHGHGVEPDIKIETSPARTAAVAIQMMTHDRQLPPLKNGKYQDEQLIRAIEILKGIRIFKKK